MPYYKSDDFSSKTSALRRRRLYRISDMDRRAAVSEEEPVSVEVKVAAGAIAVSTISLIAAFTMSASETDFFIKHTLPMFSGVLTTGAGAFALGKGYIESTALSLVSSGLSLTSIFMPLSDGVIAPTKQETPLRPEKQMEMVLHERFLPKTELAKIAEKMVNETREKHGLKIS